MKHLLIASLLLIPAVLSAASFEGKVNFKMTSGREQPRDITYNIKGDKIRVELPGQTKMGGMIMDLGKRETTVLMDEQQMYMTMPIPEAAVNAAAEKAGDVKLEKTGETEKILGYTATKYVATSGNSTTDLWLAEGLGTFMSFNQNPMGGRGRGAQNQQEWEKALAGMKDAFPLRVVGKDKNGKESFRLETTAIDKSPLPDSLFAPPAGYQKFDMGGMMKGMLPGGFGGKR
jgi:hypothetical protein